MYLSFKDIETDSLHVLLCFSICTIDYTNNTQYSICTFITIRFNGYIKEQSKIAISHDQKKNVPFGSLIDIGSICM